MAELRTRRDIHAYSYFVLLLCARADNKGEERRGGLKEREGKEEVREELNGEEEQGGRGEERRDKKYDFNDGVGG